MRARVGAGFLHILGLDFVAFRADERDVHAHLGRGEEQGGCHVVAVAYVGQVDALQPAVLLLDSEEVGQRLAGVLLVGQAVDDGHARVLGQVSTSAVREDAGHDAVHHAPQHAGHVGHALALAEADVVGPQVERVPAELGHAGLEADLRPQRGLLEDHRQLLAFQDAVRLRRSFACASVQPPGAHICHISSVLKSAIETKLRPFMLTAIRLS